MNETTKNIIHRLQTLAETDYKDFSCSLMPETEKATVLGVRVPTLRKIATELYKNDNIVFFLNDLPHIYHEEYLLHGFIVEKNKVFNKCIAETEKLLPYISNWAVCDSISRII